MSDREVKFSRVFVKVADGASLRTIIDRVVDALEKAGLSSRVIREFRECVDPSGGYAWTIDEIRNWVDTD